MAPTDQVSESHILPHPTPGEDQTSLIAASPGELTPRQATAPAACADNRPTRQGLLSTTGPTTHKTIRNNRPVP